MEKFKDRLKELREGEGMSMAQLASALGVSGAAICKWENGVAEPKVSYLLDLSDFFDCSVDYLAGKADDFSPRATAAPAAQRYTAREKQLIDCYRKLDPKQKVLIFETIKTWISLADMD